MTCGANILARETVDAAVAEGLTVEIKFVVDMTASMQPYLDAISDSLERWTAQLAQEAHDHAHAGDGEGAEGGDSEQQSLIDVMDQEPEIDESTLMSLEQVDAVLNDFEEQFRKKPKAEAEAEEAESEAAPQGELDTDAAGDDSATGPEAADDSDTHGEAGDATPDAEVTPQDTKTADVPNE